MKITKIKLRSGDRWVIERETPFGKALWSEKIFGWVLTKAASRFHTKEAANMVWTRLCLEGKALS